jgi:hypothetical protein
LPDLRVPLFSRCTALLTLLPAAPPYFAMVFPFSISMIFEDEQGGLRHASAGRP